MMPAMTEPKGEDKLYTLVYHDPSSSLKYSVSFWLRNCGTNNAGNAIICAMDIMIGVTNAVNKI